MNEYVTKRNGIIDIHNYPDDNIPEEHFLDVNEIVDDLLQNRIERETANQISSLDRNNLTLLHLSLGMWIRNVYGLWLENNPLTELGEEDSRLHPDSVSFNVIKLVWKKLQPVQD